jgi:glycerol kinase
MTHILAIDQGTTSTRAIVFDGALRPVAHAQAEFAQHYPASGWVEHEPENLWDSVVATVREVMGKTGVVPAAIGITNQRETTLLWDRETGKALHRAIVWQDRRTAAMCEDLAAQGLGAVVTARTGLLLDPYFSGTKVKWLLDHIPGARDRAKAGKLAFGTVDSFLIWRLTGGRVFMTLAATHGMPRFVRLWTFPCPCCQRCATVRMTLGSRTLPCSAAPFRLPGWRAISRPQP